MSHQKSEDTCDGDNEGESANFKKSEQCTGDGGNADQTRLKATDVEDSGMSAAGKNEAIEPDNITTNTTNNKSESSERQSGVSSEQNKTDKKMDEKGKFDPHATLRSSEEQANGHSVTQDTSKEHGTSSTREPEEIPEQGKMKSNEKDESASFSINTPGHSPQDKDPAFLDSTRKQQPDANPEKDEMKPNKSANINNEKPKQNPEGKEQDEMKPDGIDKPEHVSGGKDPSEKELDGSSAQGQQPSEEHLEQVDVSGGKDPSEKELDGSSTQGQQPSEEHLEQVDVSGGKDPSDDSSTNKQQHGINSEANNSMKKPNDTPILEQDDSPKKSASQEDTRNDCDSARHTKNSEQRNAFFK